jgi:hypothetical protein
MSTYYYLSCEKHKEYCDAASTGGFAERKCGLIDSDVTLSPFIVIHAYCGPLVVLNDESDELETYKRWTRYNVKELFEDTERVNFG